MNEWGFSSLDDALIWVKRTPLLFKTV